MSESHDVVVVGAGQAGLAASRELGQAGVEHVVLEKGRIGQTWRGRWESFCLVTPNWTLQLPGHPYDGDDPDGFMPRDEIVAYLERYAAAAGAPVREGVDVNSLTPHADGGFLLETSAGPIEARQVVLSTGAYQTPHRPPGADRLPASLLQIDVDDYTRPADLPDGAVLVVGSGQSGCQLAEELHESGRHVFLACGRAPWLPRRIGEHDFVWWAHETGFLDQHVASLPGPEARLAANLQASGHGGGHDLHYRTLHAMGVTLVGHFLGADGRRARFAQDVAASVAWGDERSAQQMDLVRKLVTERGLPEPDIAQPKPFSAQTPEELSLADLGAVIFTSGFRPAYDSWVHVPRAFDALGFPLHEDGACAAADGLYFVGVHFLRKRKSSLFIGVGEDAALVAGKISSGAYGPARPSRSTTSAPAPARRAG